ncbi:MAG: prephenate dehydratase [Deltaproteobacteria bacterium]|nr:prephenate dehydratase [Deltaproteobacteria bacterium]
MKNNNESIAFLGPEATFTHQAAVSIYGNSHELIAAENIEDVFDLVDKGECIHGIVPIENSYEGFVNRTIDLFYEYPLKILAECYCKIEHHIFSLAESLEDLERIYSHPMVYPQCRLWLKNNLPGIPFLQVPSTAYGAREASDDPKSAAICCRMAGEVYGLKCLHENIEDVPGNYTRFSVISKSSGPRPTGDDKTSMLFLLNHIPGALHKALGAIAKREINLNHIHSRPLRSRSWEYLFILDLTGHQEDPLVAEALKELEEHCVFTKHLGSYPAGSQSWRLSNKK